MKAGKLERRFTIGEASRIAFIDNSTVAVSGFKLPLRIVDVVSGATQREIKAATGRLVAAGTRVFCGGAKTAAAYDATTGKKLATFKGHGHDVLALAVSPDGATLASGSHDNTLRLWRAADGTELHKIRDPAKASVGGVAFAPDGKTVVASSQRGMLRAYAVSTGKMQFEVSIREEATWEPALLAMGPDARCYVAEEDLRDSEVPSDHPRIGVWKADKQVGALALPEGKELFLKTLACSPDGKWLAASSWKNQNRSEGKRMSIEVWDLEKRRHALRADVPDADRVYDVAFSPDSSTLVAGCPDGLVVVALPS